MSRGKFDPVAFQKGRDAETRIHEWLKWSGIPHSWLNQKTEQKNACLDFKVGKMKWEVEWKNFEDDFKWVVGWGMDFLAHKVDT